MDITANAATRRSGSPARAIVTGGLALGVADIIFAMTYWYLKAGVPPFRIFQSIAAGLLGRAAFAGGMASTALGALAHFGIATAMVAAYYLVARRYAALVQRPWRYGAAYGLVLYGVMTYIVLPLSAAPRSRPDLAWQLSSVVAHVAWGLLCAAFARMARRTGARTD